MASGDNRLLFCFNPVVIRAGRCAAGVLLLEKAIARGFNPVVIRAGRCALGTLTISVAAGSWFQSRRDPGRALRRGTMKELCGEVDMVSIPS